MHLDAVVTVINYMQQQYENVPDAVVNRSL